MGGAALNQSSPSPEPPAVWLGPKLNHVQFEKRSSASLTRNADWRQLALANSGQNHGFQTGRGLDYLSRCPSPPRRSGEPCAGRDHTGKRQPSFGRVPGSWMTQLHPCVPLARFTGAR